MAGAGSAGSGGRRAMGRTKHNDLDSVNIAAFWG